MLDKKGQVRIVDFGFTSNYDPDGFRHTWCGSPFYAAPEMVQGRPYVGPEVDVWSLGVILFFLLVGRTPFEGHNLPEIYRKITLGHFEIPPSVSQGECVALPALACFQMG